MTDKIKIKRPVDDAFVGCAHFVSYEVDRGMWGEMTGTRYEDWEAFLEHCAQTQGALRHLMRGPEK